MGKIATTASLSNYPKITISLYKEQIKQHPKAEVIKVSYSHRGKDYCYPIHLVKTACNYGGYRYWFLCPHCQRKISVLYCAGLYACRHCINANYATQLMQPLDKLFRKVEKIRHRLQWQAGIAHGHGNRPKGMHQSTYDRLVNEHDNLVNRICGISMEQINKMKQQTAKAG